MEENKIPVTNDWSNIERWFSELIEQTRANARRWFIAWLITLIALIGTNMAWIYVFQSYDYVSQTSEGVNSINSGTQGDIVNEPEGEIEKER